MLKIAICDDDEKDREYLQGIINEIVDNWNEKFDIKSFDSGEKLCESLNKENYNIIFLDIQMAGIDGVETLKRIKKMGIESYIVFISTYDKRLKELFADKVIDFVSKPAKSDQIEKNVKLVADMLSFKKVFTYKKNGNPHAIYLSDILCFESKGHYILIHMKNECVKFKGRMPEVLGRLENNPMFCMPHRSYIINFKHTKFISRTEVEIVPAYTNKIIIPIGRQYKVDTDNRLMKYMKNIGCEND